MDVRTFCESIRNVAVEAGKGEVISSVTDCCMEYSARRKAIILFLFFFFLEDRQIRLLSRCATTLPEVVVDDFKLEVLRS